MNQKISKNQTNGGVDYLTAKQLGCVPFIRLSNFYKGNTFDGCCEVISAGAENLGQRGQSPSGWGAEPLHFLLCFTGYCYLILINNTYFIKLCLFHTDFS